MTHLAAHLMKWMTHMSWSKLVNTQLDKIAEIDLHTSDCIMKAVTGIQWSAWSAFLWLNWAHIFLCIPGIILLLTGITSKQHSFHCRPIIQYSLQSFPGEPRRLQIVFRHRRVHIWRVTGLPDYSRSSSTCKLSLFYNLSAYRLYQEEKDILSSVKKWKKLEACVTFENLRVTFGTVYTKSFSNLGVKFYNTTVHVWKCLNV